MPRLSRLLESLGDYGNPLEVLFQRRLRRDDEVIRVVDRRSGLAVRCRLAAHRMFGEVWFDHDYDVPGVALRKGDLVIDIGANQGFFTCYAAWKGCSVYAFEPDRENFTLLESNVAANGFTAQVKLFPNAVKGEGGSTTLYRTAQLGGGMHTTNAAVAEKLGLVAKDGVEVTSVTLPEFLSRERIERIRLIKMDCEGAELEIVESLDRQTAVRIDSMALEYHPAAYSPSRLVRFLEDLGTHHLSLAAPKYCEREILYAVSKAAFAEAPDFLRHEASPRRE